jgi:hypothetical protein
MRIRTTVACALTAFAAVAGGTAEATGLIQTANIARGAVTLNRLAPNVQKMVTAKNTPGKDGLNGLDGIPGAKGSTGAQGLPGALGPQGPQGIKGDKGDTGLKGPTGSNGSNGSNGANGVNGVDGARGPQGAKGDTGATGPQGAAGTNGVDGKNGVDGTNGVDGAKGDTGATGATGTVATYDASGAVQTTHIVRGTAVMGNNSTSLSVALTGSAAFGDSNWACIARDVTSDSEDVTVGYTDSTHFTLSGSSGIEGDTLFFSCF